MKSEEKILEKEFDSICSVGTMPGILYGNPKVHHIKVQLLRSIFKCNNCPINIMDQCIKKFLDKLYFPEQIVPIVPKKELLVVLPYLGISL